MKLRRLILSVIIINLIITGWGLIILPTNVDADKIIKFGNSGDVPDRTLTITGNSAPYMDSTTYFELPNSRGLVKSAELKISPLHLGSDYSYFPKVDVGIDGDVDWQFSGPGYGDFGSQYKFSDNSQSIYVNIPSAGTNSAFSIRIPWKATVTLTEMTLDATSSPTKPTDPSLKVGDSSSSDVWAKTGQFQTSVPVTNFHDEINNFLIANTTPEEDDYGNEYVDVPLLFSAVTGGQITASSLNIKYDWDAVIDKSPDSLDLARRLNDLIQVNTSGKYSGETKIYVAVYSETPCTVKLSGLQVEYNAAPMINKIPSDFSVPEDSNRENLINLSTYVNDDYQKSIYLDYEVVSYTNSKYVDVDIFDKWNLGVVADKDPHTNWHGSTDVVISARDAQGVRALSNEFTVTISKVNDPPKVWLPIPNLNITANQSNFDIDLDDPVMVEGIEGYYFTDIDSPNLYYKAIAAPSAAESLILKIASGNVLNITAVGEYRLNIPVRIFCGDDQFEIMKLSNYNANGVYQDINVNITSSGGKTPPFWSTLPNVKISEDTILDNWLNLFDYVTDFDDGNENLTFSVVTVSNSAYMTISIDPDGNIDLLPATNFDGTSIVYVKVEDDEYNYDIEDFTIEMIPKNDLPVVAFIKPTARQTLSGIIEIQGSAYDTEDMLQRVELRFGEVGEEWITAQGTKYWKYYWDSVPFAPGSSKLVTIYARAFDGMNNSAEASVEIIVNNVNTDADGDGVDNSIDIFPNDPSEWMDSDSDGHGNNKDAFPNNESEWADSDGDGFGDNIDLFPYMASDWIDTDGDGYGDNSDVYPNDKSKHALAGGSSGDEAEEDDGSVTGLLWMLVIIIIIINVLIFIAYAMAKRKEKSLKKKK
jgi:hypothetical protein